MMGPHIATDAVRRQLKKILDRNGRREKAEQVRKTLQAIRGRNMSEFKEKTMDAPDLQDVPTEELSVTPQPTPVKSKIGDEEFVKQLNDLLKSGAVWRTSKVLADKLKVDPVALDAFLRSQQTIVGRAAKEEGVFLYALMDRLPKDEKKGEDITRPLVTEEDRYALSTINCALILLGKALNKTAVRIHTCNPEAFTQLVKAKEQMEAGLVLYGKRLHADFNKLPEV